MEDEKNEILESSKEENLENVENVEKEKSVKKSDVKIDISTPALDNYKSYKSLLSASKPIEVVEG